MTAEHKDWIEFLNLAVNKLQLKENAATEFLAIYQPCGLDGSGFVRLKDLTIANSDRRKKIMLKDIYPALKKIDDKALLGENDKIFQLLHWLIEDYKNRKFIDRPDNIAQKLNSLLNELNYLEQKQQVEREFNKNDVAKMVLIEANGFFTQRWLVQRLALKVQNHSQSKSYGIDVDPKWDRNFSLFWKSISSQIGANKNLDDPGEIVQELCAFCRDSPLIIAVYGIQLIKPETLRNLLSVFWECLMRGLDEQFKYSEHGDCILFLTTNTGTHQEIKLTSSMSNIQADQQISTKETVFHPSHYMIDLTPWEMITVGEIKQWLKPLEAKQLLAQCAGEISDLLVPEHQLADEHPLGSTEEILWKICKTFNVSKFADLETYWKIAL